MSNWLSNAWQTIWKNKTKAAGYAAQLAGAVQMYLPQAGIFLSAKQMAATTFIIGVLVALIGHYNDWANKSTGQP
jgi:hypothetical protein